MDRQPHLTSSRNSGLKVAHYFGQQFSRSRRDPGKDFEIVKEMVETFKNFDNCVVTGANSISGLYYLVFKTATQAEEKNDIQQLGDQHR